jgi:hypothetical protein
VAAKEEEVEEMGEDLAEEKEEATGEDLAEEKAVDSVEEMGEETGEAGEGEMVEGTEEGKGVVGGGMAVGMEARAAVSARTIQQP